MVIVVVVVVAALVVLVNELDAASGDISPRRVEDRSAHRNRKQNKRTKMREKKKTTVGELSDARNDPVRGLARGRRPFDGEEADLFFSVSRFAPFAARNDPHLEREPDGVWSDPVPLLGTLSVRRGIILCLSVCLPVWAPFTPKAVATLFPHRVQKTRCPPGAQVRFKNTFGAYLFRACLQK